MTAIGRADRSTNAETSLGEIQAIPNLAADAVKRHPFDELRIDATLQNEIFNQVTDFVFGEGGDDGGVHSKRASQTAGNVVFAAAFPCPKLSRRANPSLTGIETQHDFTREMRS